MIPVTIITRLRRFYNAAQPGPRKNGKTKTRRLCGPACRRGKQRKECFLYRDDGSHFPIEENIAKTSELVKVCHEKGLSIEAEVGSIGGEEDGVIGAGEIADPNECKKIADLGVDFLAAGIGNIHGKYPANWKGLDFDALAKTKELIGDLPLVLHGGTGIPADMIQKAISLGVAKINVNTECQLYFQEATRKYIEEGKDLEGKGFDPRKLLAPGFEAIKVIVKEKMELFGSINKA